MLQIRSKFQGKLIIAGLQRLEKAGAQYVAQHIKRTQQRNLGWPGGAIYSLPRERQGEGGRRGADTGHHTQAACLSGESLNLWEGGSYQGDQTPTQNDATLRWKTDTARDQNRDRHSWAATVNLWRGTTGLSTPVASGTGRPTFISTTYPTLPWSRDVAASSTTHSCTTSEPFQNMNRATRGESFSHCPHEAQEP